MTFAYPFLSTIFLIVSATNIAEFSPNLYVSGRIAYLNPSDEFFLFFFALFLFIDNAMHEIAATTAKYFYVVIEDILFL